MLEIVPRKLWICECRESGSMTNLRGAVEEARRLIALSGGFAVMREKLRREKTERVSAKRREKQRRRHGFDSAGSYQPQT